MKNIFKAFLPSLLPILVFITGFIICTKADTFAEFQLSFISYLPYVILPFTAAIAWRFNRSRTFFVAVFLLAALYSIEHQSQLPVDQDKFFQLFCILLPFDLLIFAFLKERGILSLWGGLRFGFLLLQAGLILSTLGPDQPLDSELSKYLEPMKQNFLHGMSSAAFLMFLLAFVLIIIRILFYQASQDITLLSVLIILLYLLSRNRSLEYSVYCSVIGIILVLSILKESHNMAFYDELTRLPSRRSLNQDLMKLGLRYSIAMLDIDHFKKFNDTYGHDIGDEALKYVASLLKEVDGGGKAYRYGGEEFTILFPGKSLNDTLPTLDTLREEIARKGFVIRQKRRKKTGSGRSTASQSNRRNSTASTYKKIPIHVSIGIAQKNDELKTPDLVLKAADSALYRAKKKGRNCVSK